MFSWIVLIADVSAIVGVNWYFLMAPRTAVAARASANAGQRLPLRWKADIHHRRCGSRAVFAFAWSSIARSPYCKLS